MTPSIDRLSGLLDRFRVRAHLFHAGALCGTTAFEAKPGRAFLHVLRRGELVVTHGRVKGLERRVVMHEPTVMLYPRPVAHTFHNPPRDGSDFTCATLDFDGAGHNPLVAALPALVLVPLEQVEGLQPALDLLFAETDRVRCGSRLLADRLFEVVLIQLLRWLIDHPGAGGVGSGLISVAPPRTARPATHETLAFGPGRRPGERGAALAGPRGGRPPGCRGWSVSLQLLHRASRDPRRMKRAQLGRHCVGGATRSCRARAKAIGRPTPLMSSEPGCARLSPFTSLRRPPDGLGGTAGVPLPSNTDARCRIGTAGRSAQ